MSASAVLNILVGIAVGGWLVFGGMASKLANAAGAGSSSTTRTVMDQPTKQGAGLVMV